MQAAELTRITMDPSDGQHLPISKLKFTDPDTLEFEVQSTQDEEEDEENDEEEEQKDDGEKEKKGPKKPQKKVHHFAWSVSSQTLTELDDYTEPDAHPSWGSMSPDGEWVVYARDLNLWYAATTRALSAHLPAETTTPVPMLPESARGFGLSVVLLSVFRGRMMRGVDYERIVDARRGAKSAKEAQEAEDKLDKEEGLEEIQLTTDGEEFYEYVRATPPKKTLVLLVLSTAASIEPSSCLRWS